MLGSAQEARCQGIFRRSRPLSRFARAGSGLCCLDGSDSRHHRHIMIVVVCSILALSRLLFVLVSMVVRLVVRKSLYVRITWCEHRNLNRRSSSFVYVVPRRERLDLNSPLAILQSRGTLPARLVIRSSLDEG